MIPYFKKYSIFVCIVAVALPIVVSTIWPLLTGHMMAASIGGLIGMFVLFILGLLLGYAIFERKAESVVDGYLAQYNEECDPEALVSEGSNLASAIQFPCNQIGSWFMGYYAQALLDIGQPGRAREIYDGLMTSYQASRKPTEKAGILANILPLSEKMDDVDTTLGLINEGLALCDAGGKNVAPLRDFLFSQKRILDARKLGDQRVIGDLAEKVRSSAQYPMRLRVEYAWDEASADYRLGDLAEERRCLEFVVARGNKLALVAKAKDRLEKLL